MDALPSLKFGHGKERGFQSLSLRGRNSILPTLSEAALLEEVPLTQKDRATSALDDVRSFQSDPEAARQFPTCYLRQLSSVLLNVVNNLGKLLLKACYELCFETTPSLVSVQYLYRAWKVEGYRPYAKAFVIARSHGAKSYKPMIRARLNKHTNTRLGKGLYWVLLTLPTELWQPISK